VSLADIRVARGALSPSGDRALTIDGLSLRLWDSATGDLLVKGRLSSPSNDVRFSPDGRLVIVATGGGSARVIDAETLNTELRLPWASQFAEPIAPGIPGILDPLITAGMSHDGDRVAFAPNDNSVRIWFVGRDLNRLIQHARRRLPRCLTVEEETKYFLRTPEDADPPRNCRHPR
jgi:WD40 repeat protein